MENMITFFDIPATDFSRAVSFYKAILGVEISEADISGMFIDSEGNKMAVHSPN